VFWGHFFEVFLYKNEYASELGSAFIVFFKKSVINGNFWVSVFCIISGYLCFGSKVNSFLSLFKNYVKRYIRFVLPISLVLAFTIIIKYTIGFHTVEFSQLLRGGWGEYYTEDIFCINDYLKCVLLFDSTLNGPIWMIQPLFIANCALITFKYLQEKFHLDLFVLWNGILIFLFLVLAVLNVRGLESLSKYMYCFISVYAGSYIRANQKYIKISLSLRRLVIILAIITIMMGGLHDFITGLFVTHGVVLLNMLRIHLYGIWPFIYAMILVLALFAFNNDKQFEIKNKKLLNFTGNSLSIYLLHWPIMCSFGGYMLKEFIQVGMSYSQAVIFLFLVLNVLVIVCSQLYELVYKKLNMFCYGVYRR
jgi:peptidoglycan/LPS O-acetylase OafA/YrhL